MPTIIALTILAAAVPGAERGFWLGAAAVADFGGPGFIYGAIGENGEVTDSLIIQHGDAYWGAAADAGYAPADWVRFEMTLAELRAEWLGSVSVALAPSVGLNVQLLPPVSWRVRPYVWTGGNWTMRLYTALPAGNFYVVEPMMTLRAGPGVAVRITPRLSAFLATDFWGVTRVSDVDSRLGTVWDMEFGWLGVTRPRAGIRYFLP